jgi:hypothetical protein
VHVHDRLPIGLSGRFAGPPADPVHDGVALAFPRRGDGSGGLRDSARRNRQREQKKRGADGADETAQRNLRAFEPRNAGL